MGRRPWRCYRQQKVRGYIKSKYCRGVPDPRIRIHDAGKKNANVLEFPKLVYLKSLEKEQISAEALETARITANKYMFNNAGADRLQTGMRGAFGKPYGLCARVNMGQRILQIRTKEQFVKHAVEALTRAKHKFPGKYEVIVSNEHGFTQLDANTFEDLKQKGLLIDRTDHVHIIKEKGPKEHVEKLKQRAIGYDP